MLDPSVLSRLLDDVLERGAVADDELWVRIVYTFLEATNRGAASTEHLADMFVPIYMWRAARFMSQTADEPVGIVQTRLNALCDAFQRLKPALVDGWGGK